MIWGGVVSGESRVNSARVRWSTGDRATRYREQAGRFEALAKMEDRPDARERLLELAEQYGELAGLVMRRNRRDRGRTPPGTGGRQG